MICLRLSTVNKLPRGNGDGNSLPYAASAFTPQRQPVGTRPNHESSLIYANPLLFVPREDQENKDAGRTDAGITKDVVSLHFHRIDGSYCVSGGHLASITLNSCVTDTCGGISPLPPPL